MPCGTDFGNRINRNEANSLTLKDKEEKEKRLGQSSAGHLLILSIVGKYYSY